MEEGTKNIVIAQPQERKKTKRSKTLAQKALTDKIKTTLL